MEDEILKCCGTCGYSEWNAEYYDVDDVYGWCFCCNEDSERYTDDVNYYEKCDKFIHISDCEFSSNDHEIN